MCPSPLGLLEQDTTDCVVYKQQTLISHSSGAWKAKIKALTDVFREDQPRGSRELSYVWVLVWRKRKGGSLALTHEDSTLMT